MTKRYICEIRDTNTGYNVIHKWLVDDVEELESIEDGFDTITEAEAALENVIKSEANRLLEALWRHPEKDMVFCGEGIPYTTEAEYLHEKLYNAYTFGIEIDFTA